MENITVVYGKENMNSFSLRGEAPYRRLADEETETQRGPPTCPDVTQLMNG